MVVKFVINYERDAFNTQMRIFTLFWNIYRTTRRLWKPNKIIRIYNNYELEDFCELKSQYSIKTWCYNILKNQYYFLVLMWCYIFYGWYAWWWCLNCMFSLFYHILLLSISLLLFSVFWMYGFIDEIFYIFGFLIFGMLSYSILMDQHKFNKNNDFYKAKKIK